MKKNWLRQIIVGILLLGMMSVSTLAAQDIKQYEITRANLKLAEMKYEHIEYTEIENLLKQIDEIIDKEDKEAFYNWDEAYYGLYCKVNTMIQIAQLNYQLHTNQSQYFDEYLYSVDLLGKMKTAYIRAFEEKEDTLSKDMMKFYELSIERSKLVDEYLAKELNVTITANNKKMTLVDILKDSSLTDSEMSTLYDEWYTAYNKATGEIMLKLIKIDNQIAGLQGYDTYAEAAYKSYSRDYTPEQIKDFIVAVKEVIPSTFLKIYKSNLAATSILSSYSYESDTSLLQSMDKGFISHHKELKEAYDYMRKYELYDIETREYKENGGFTTYFDQLAEPYIVINYVEPYETALTFIHEFGHYFSYYKIGNNEGGLDLDETYSQTLELLAMPYYSEIFENDQFSKAAKIYTVENMLGAILQGCLYDEFLQEVYKNPNITVDEMNELYSKIAQEYGLRVDGRSWCNVPHNFQTPFYYISYSVSAVAALEVWTKSLELEEVGINTYLKLIEAGKEKSFIDSLKSVGLSNPFEKETLRKIVLGIETYFDIGEQASELKNAA